MHKLKSVMRLLLSQKTLVSLYLGLIAVCVTGSLMLPYNLAFFSGIDDAQLFKWLDKAGSPVLTWWIYGLIVMLAFLAISTITCTIDAVLKPSMRSSLMTKLPPQVLHIGVLFVMLGHLLTASMGLKTDILIEKGARAAIPGGGEVYLNDVFSQKDESGYYTAWEAELWIYEGGQKVAEKILRPLEPVYSGLTGLNFKSINLPDEEGAIPSALIRACIDPGAPWALLGGVLTALAAVAMAWSKARSSTQWPAKPDID